MTYIRPTKPLTLRKWRAERAGPGITVYGTDIDTGEETKVTRVLAIVPPTNAAEHHVVARDEMGLEHRLTFAA